MSCYFITSGHFLKIEYNFILHALLSNTILNQKNTYNMTGDNTGFQVFPCGLFSRIVTADNNKRFEFRKIRF